MDKASHLSVVLDLSPKQWYLAAQPTNANPITLSTFLSHLLAFLNAHIACKDENSLAVFGALPGKRCVSYIPQLDSSFTSGSLQCHVIFLYDARLRRRY